MFGSAPFGSAPFGSGPEETGATGSFVLSGGGSLSATGAKTAHATGTLSGGGSLAGTGKKTAHVTAVDDGGGVSVAAVVAIYAVLGGGTVDTTGAVIAGPRVVFEPI